MGLEERGGCQQRSTDKVERLRGHRAPRGAKPASEHLATGKTSTEKEVKIDLGSLRGRLASARGFQAWKRLAVPVVLPGLPIHWIAATQRTGIPGRRS